MENRVSRFAVYLLPAIISQSLIMGGGYATGREIVQWAARFGPPGWIGVLVIFVGFSLMSIFAFEIARLGKAYDYKAWARQLVGPLWPVYDFLALSMMLLIIAVMSAAMGSILQQTIGLPSRVGVLIAVIFVGFLAFKGSAVLELFKTIGSVALYAAYIGFAIVVLTAVPAPAAAAAAATEPVTTAQILISAMQYVGYNLATFPAVLFCLHRQTRRSETVASGLLSGLAMTVPFALTFVCLMRFWPNDGIFGAEVPWLVMLDTATGGSRFWIVVFGIVVGWTLLETAVGGIHALVDRVEHNIDDLPRFMRPKSGELTPALRAGSSIFVLLLAMGLSGFGIIDLVAKGYGFLSWGFILFMGLPLLVVGSYRMLTTPGS
jgi:uncharacterized membrane protein YkvI